MVSFKYGHVGDFYFFDRKVCARCGHYLSLHLLKPTEKKSEGHCHALVATIFRGDLFFAECSCDRVALQKELNVGEIRVAKGIW